MFDGEGNVVYRSVEITPVDVTNRGNGTVVGEKKEAYRIRIMRRRGSLLVWVCFRLWRRLQGKVLRNGGS